ncbi:hypothetical protein GW17_00035628 [Ensete ventricosum]|nr:hypothetical protein GW17_00035628 [Ensete ventricosum]
MAMPGRGRRGVGASDNDGDAVRELDAGVSTTVAGNRWGDNNSGRGGGDDKGRATLVEDEDDGSRGKKRKKMRASIGVRQDSATDIEQE